MRKLGEILKEARVARRLSQKEIAKRLLQKPSVIEALEGGNWGALPEAAYVKGFIKSYANILGLDSEKLLALHRAEYDERKYVRPKQRRKKRLMFTPNLIPPLVFGLAVLIFFVYMIIQYTSIASAPKIEVYSPQDDITTSANIIEVSGKTEKETTVSIDGQLAPVDDLGNFNLQIPLSDGRNTIEIVASKKLSPKTKITRVVRLAR